MTRLKSIVLIVSALLCACICALGLAGIVLTHRAQTAAAKMETFEWVHNDRCLDKVAGMSEPRDGFRFAVFGDLQVGTAQLPRLMDALKEREPVDFIIQIGDISTGPDVGHYELLMKGLAGSGLERPMFVVPGNHDVREGGDELFKRYFGPAQFRFEYGGALFIILDNSRGPFTEEQCDWLEQILAERRDGVRNVFLFMHAQPIHWEGDGRGPVADLYGCLYELVVRYKIDYVFAGNWHGYHREERDGTIFVINGRGGSGRHLLPAFYTIVDVDRRGVSDRCFVLPPHAGTLAKSLIDDWFIAHLGRFAADHLFVVSFVVFLAALGAICPFILARR